MDTLVHWGLGIVQWIQTFRSPGLDQLFLTFNFLGLEEFYILFLPLFFWCLHKRVGIRLSLVLVFSFFVNFSLKEFFAAPRPYEVDTSLYAPIKTIGYGIPSAHAQGTTTLWGYLATQFRSRAWWALAIVIPVVVSIGRMYLGDHFPQDVLAGIGLGIALIVVWETLTPRLEEWWNAQGSLLLKLALAVGTPLLLAVIHLSPYTAIPLGLMLGFSLGFVIEEEWIHAETRGEWWKQVCKFLLGIAVMLGLRSGLKAILPDAAIFSGLLYAFIGLWIALGAPWLFVMARLAGTGKTSGPVASPTVALS